MLRGSSPGKYCPRSAVGIGFIALFGMSPVGKKGLALGAGGRSFDVSTKCAFVGSKSRPTDTQYMAVIDFGTQQHLEFGVAAHLRWTLPLAPFRKQHSYRLF